jgi:monofunctional biosynthetic peptidoglycan transglycosylase
MTPRECAFLAAMLPGPRVAYNPYRNMEKVLRRSDMILKLLKEKRVLSDAEYAAAVATAPNVNGLQRKVEENMNNDELFTNQSSVVSLPVQQDIAAERSFTSQTEQGRGSAERDALESAKPENRANK